MKRITMNPENPLFVRLSRFVIIILYGHFNATMMLKHGVTEREAQERLGHSNSTMTKKYQQVLKEMDQKSADKLNNILVNKKASTI